MPGLSVSEAGERMGLPEAHRKSTRPIQETTGGKMPTMANCLSSKEESSPKTRYQAATLNNHRALPATQKRVWADKGGPCASAEEEPGGEGGGGDTAQKDDGGDGVPPELPRKKQQAEAGCEP